MPGYLLELLLIGLQKYTQESHPDYPYPSELAAAMNGLAHKLGNKYPTTFPAVLEMMHAPMGDWYPIPIPEPFDSDTTLLYNRQLDYQAREYVASSRIANSVGIADLIRKDENELIIQLIQRARTDYAEETGGHTKSEVDYAEARRYLIDHPFTTLQELRRSLRNNQYVSYIEEMYEEAHSARRLAHAQNGDYLICPLCGPLLRGRGSNPESLKPDACLGRCPTASGWNTHPATPNLFVVKEDIQQRTVVPGREEIDLYDALQAIEHKQQAKVLVDVRLYPGIDRYDLQLVFEYENDRKDACREVWAVDIKDYADRNLNRLAKKINRELQDGLGTAFPNFVSSLKWDQAFYVFPDYRERAYPRYCDEFRGAIQSHRFKNLNIMTTTDFLNTVRKHIWELI